jgi:hypothetical protein
MRAVQSGVILRAKRNSPIPEVLALEVRFDATARSVTLANIKGRAVIISGISDENVHASLSELST